MKDSLNVLQGHFSNCQAPLPPTSDKTRVTSSSSSDQTIPTTMTPTTNATGLLVTGGNNDFEEGDTIASVEVLLPSPALPACVVPPLPSPRNSHVTFVFGDKVLTCGGWNDNTCIAFNPSNKAWEIHSYLTSNKRSRSSAINIKGRPCMVGGNSYGDKAHKSIECLSDVSTWELLNDVIPGKGVKWGCGVNIGAHALFVGGWYDKKQVLERKDNGTWTFWPSLSQRRYGHSCAAMNNNVYVSGGWMGENIASSVLIINTITRQTVNMKENLKEPRVYHSMTVWGNQLWVVGGYGGETLKYAYLRKYDNKTWSVEPSVELSVPRDEFGLAEVPLMLLGC